MKGQAGDPDITITISAPRAIMESFLKGETEDNGYGGQQPKYFINYATKQVERNLGAWYTWRGLITISDLTNKLVQN